jgi:flagellar L-ring protein precursor FlgH
MQKQLKFAGLAMLSLTLGCARADHIGSTPDFTPAIDAPEARTMIEPGLPVILLDRRPADAASLWSPSRASLLGDRRAVVRGDILTVVIEIDESAEISNSSDRSRSGSENLSVPGLFGLPQRVDEKLPEGASSAELVGISSQSNSSGDGSVKRNEKLELRVAATVVDVLPNGILSISGSQELRVNYELRELLVTGFVRPADISRQNEITYDKIASARVSYGGRGQISDMQQPRIGQQLLDVILPF